MAMQSLGDSLVNQSPAVQDQITGNEKSQTRTKEQQIPAFISKAEMLQMRRWIVEMSEELKIKRKMVTEAETRAEALAGQLHSLQMQKDSEQQEGKQREEKLEHSLARLKQQCEDRLKAAEVEQIQQQVRKENRCYRQDKSREEIRQLKAAVHQKEKQIRELEAQLQTEKAASGKLLTQWQEAEGKFEELNQLYRVCHKSLSRLEEAGRFLG